MLRVGFVQYLNSLPLYAPFQKNALTFTGKLTYATPTRLNSLFRTKELDLSFISITEFLNGDYDYLPYGIVAKGKILSVTLYKREDLPSLEGVAIALTEESAASTALLKLLCSKFWKVNPRFIPLDCHKHLSEYPAFLLIGDQALKHRHFPGYVTVDLAEQWHKYTHLPFVFALFAVHKEVMQKRSSEVDLFTNQLSAALAWSKEHTSTVEVMAQEKSSLPLSLVKSYFSLCTYSLDPQELKSIETFRHIIHD